MKLHQKLLFVMSLLVFIPIIIIFITGSHIFSNAFEEFIKSKTEETISVTLNHIEDYREKIRATGELAAGSLEFKKAILEGNDLVISSFLDRIRDFIILAQIDVYNESGELIFTSSNENSDFEIGKDKNLEFVNLGLNLRKSERLILENSSLMVKSIHPVVSSDLHCMGVLIISYPFNREFLDLLKIVINTELMLYTSSGNIIATTLIDDNGVEFKNEVEVIFKKNVKKQNKKRLIFSGNVVNQNYSFGIDYIKKNGNKIAGIIGVAVPKTWFKAAVGKIKSYFLKFVITALIIVFILSMLISKSITNPLRKLSFWAQQIESGAPLEKIDINSNDEVGELARVFNKMVEKIVNTLQNLEKTNEELDNKLHETRVLFDISQTINYIPDTKELLIKIIDKTIDATGADHSSIMLMDENSDNLQLTLVRGIDYDNNKKTTIKKGIGIAGIVIDTGEPILVNEGNEDPRFIFFTEKRKVRAMMCIPLLNSGKPFGVINIVIRDSQNKKAKFSRKDLRLAISIANQIALVVDKAKLYQASITDGMTKLYIHNYFKARLKEEVRRAKRYDKSLTLIMCDLDHFKSFNDDYGHQMGDKVLCEFSDIIREAVREHLDIPARYGGEEFAIICPETSIEGAKTLAERIRISIYEAKFEQDGKSIQVTSSFGISIVDESVKDMAELIKNADLALYSSKDKGRNMVTVYNEQLTMNN